MARRCRVPKVGPAAIMVVAACIVSFVLFEVLDIDGSRSPTAATTPTRALESSKSEEIKHPGLQGPVRVGLECPFLINPAIDVIIGTHPLVTSPIVPLRNRTSPTAMARANLPAPPFAA